MNLLEYFSDYFGVMSPFILFALISWVVVWKGISLWRAARNNDLVWFIVLLVINTLGILEILYTFIWSKKPRKK